jgi:hypothetical protein
MQSLKPMQLAFFSYAHEDAEFALRLAKDLRAAGAAVWIDRLDIKVGERWDRAVGEALAKCPQLLVILSPASVDSTNVMDEVSFALDKGKHVLPVIHRQCEIPFRLHRLHYVDLTLNYDEGLGRLVEALGFTERPSKLAENDVKQADQGRAAPSGHGGTPWQVTLPNKRVVGLLVAIIVVVALWATLRPKPRPISPRPPRPLPGLITAPNDTGKWIVRIGNYDDRAEAERRQTEAVQKCKLTNSVIFQQQDRHFLRFTFDTEAQADAAIECLKAHGISGSPTKINPPRTR